MKKNNRGISIIIIVAFICSFFELYGSNLDNTTSIINATAADNPYSQDYNIIDTVNYAVKWYKKENPDYKKIDGFAFEKNEHCASFVSQCLTAGGILIPKVKRSMEWSNGKLHYKYENLEWSKAQNQYDYLVGLGYSSEEANSTNIHIGDIVYYDWKSDGYGRINHATICVGITTVGDPIIAEHSNCRIGVWNQRRDEFKAYVVNMTNAVGHLDVTDEYCSKQLSIRSLKTSSYVSSDTDNPELSSVIAVANRASVNEWERINTIINRSIPTCLKVCYLDENKNDTEIYTSLTPSISFLTNTGRYLSAFVSENRSPLKNTANNSTWEAFRIYKSNDKEYILSLRNGKFVSVLNDDKLYASGNGGWSWEEFDITILNSLSSNSNNKKSYTIRSSNGAKIRNDVGTSSAQVGGLAKGSIVYYDNEKQANGYTWYHIIDVSAKTGSWGDFINYWVANV